MAQRAMRNRQFIGYTLGPLVRNVNERLYDSEGAVKFVFGQWTDNLFLVPGTGKSHQNTSAGKFDPERP